MKFKKLIKQASRQFLFLSIISFFIGTATSLFLLGLDWIQTLSYQSIRLWFLLPIIAICLQWIKKRFPSLHHTGTNQFIELTQKKENSTSPFFSIYILLATWFSHIGGASVGREGTAVQMGASISNSLSSVFRFSKEEKSIWIKAGMSAGFASVFGTPWAGTLFGLEITKVGHYSFKAILPCLLAAFLSNWVSLHVYNTNHTLYPSIFLPSLNPSLWLKLFILSLFLSLLAYLYKALESNIYKLSEQLPKHFILKGIISGLIIAILLNYKTFESSIGLGSEKFLAPFSNTLEPYYFLKKIIATASSLGFGFKGGEATPLFLIGSHAGAYVANELALPISLAAAIGFVALYGGLAKTPLTAMFMGIELFGIDAWYIYLLSTLIISYLSGKKGLFSSQEWNGKIPTPLY